MNKPAVRICNWGRQTGKTRFIINDAKAHAQDASKLCMIVACDNNQQCIIRECFIKDAVDASRIKFVTSREFKEYTQTGKCRGLGRYNRLFIYFDEVTYMNFSFEEMMIAVNNLRTATLANNDTYNTMLTFTMTQEQQPTTLDRLNSQVFEKTWYDNHRAD